MTAGQLKELTLAFILIKFAEQYIQKHKRYSLAVCDTENRNTEIS